MAVVSTREFTPAVTLQRCRNSQEWAGGAAQSCSLQQYDLRLPGVRRSRWYPFAAGVYTQRCHRSRSCGESKTRKLLL